MISAKQIYDYIDSIAPFSSQMGFDNSGLLVGCENTTSDRVLVALDATKSVLDEATNLDAAIIVTHHPVIFDPLKSLLSDSIPYLAAKLGITVISAHTNLDIARDGVNDTLAKAVGVDPEVRLDDECVCIGKLKNAEGCRTFAEKIRDKLKLKGIRFTDTGRDIRTVAVSCGAGGDSVFTAKKYGADAVVTGEIKHHEILFAKNNDIAVFDLGHYGSEKLIVPVLSDMLQGHFTDTEFIASRADTDGIIYC